MGWREKKRIFNAVSRRKAKLLGFAHKADCGMKREKNGNGNGREFDETLLRRAVQCLGMFEVK